MEVNEAEDRIFNSEKANQIKDEFLELYTKIGEILSSSHFAEFLDIFKSDGVTLKTDAAIDVFKSMLVSNLKKAFNQMWEYQNISQSLSILEYLKSKYKYKTKPQWRPYGKSVQEQTMPLRIKILKRKGLYLEKQLAFQRGQIEDMIAKVESSRKYIEEISQRRSIFLHEISIREDQYPKLKEEIRHLQLKAIDMI